ncbi:hypothetical protein HPB49_011141 [Dermacentor silvarum]|uniref:Uncharacterized protein n=1 Tax=Dermacentor silvarum TaxID=543639 RepID=A0ACB8CEX1_DERSI|nr:hypothetical protein HPB49_011141 [Dermacentor silvarum]
MEAQQFGEPLVNFSVDLYRQLLTKKHQRENIFFSPFSIFVALSMSLAGARGNTARQLAKVLHVNSEEIHTHFSQFLSKLDGFAPDVKLSVVNRMYCEQSFPVLDTYLSF